VTRDVPVLALLLAAGASSRFPGDKRLAKLGNGKTVLQTSVDLLAAVLDSVFVVIKPEDAGTGRLPYEAPHSGVCSLLATGAAGGMGCSLAEAVKQLPADCHVMIALGDMPYIRTTTIHAVLQRFQSSEKAAPIVFPLFRESHRGHPVIFHRNYRTELEALGGDTGAGGIVSAYPQAHEPLAVSDRGVLSDIDEPGDLDQAGFSA